MSDHIYLRMTIDVCLFTEDDSTLKGMAKTLVREGKSLGVGERVARDFMDKIKRGVIEIDEIRDVVNHS